MHKFVKQAVLALTLGATVAGAVPAVADPGHDRGRHGGWDRGDRGERGRWDRDDRRGPPPWARAEGRRDHWRNYDYNRREPGLSGYYPDRYYRSGYRPIRVTRETRIYRGYDNRYYCRRSDGTTGLIVGAALGGVLGNQIGRGDSQVLATLLGVGAGAAIGNSIDRGNVVCR